MPNPNQHPSLFPSPDEQLRATLAINVHPASGDAPYPLASLPNRGDGEFKIRAGALIDLIGDAKTGDEIVFEVVPPPILAFADNRIVVNEVERTVTVDNSPQSFGDRNFEVLRVLARRPNTVLSWEYIAEAVWPDYPAKKFDNARYKVEVCIGRIRKVLGPELRDAIRTFPTRRYCALSSLLGEVAILNGEPPGSVDSNADAVLSFADNRIQVNKGSRTVTVDNAQRPLGLIPYKVLQTLAERVDTVVQHKEIAAEVWGMRDPAELERRCRNIHVCVTRIRNILGPELREVICNYRNLGYYVPSSLTKPKEPNLYT